MVVACVASVSSRVVRAGAKKKKTKWKGRGRGEEETLARKPHDSGKRPLIFHDSWSTKITNRLPDLKKLLCSLKHAPRDCKTVIKRSFTIKEGWNSKRLLRNFLFFIVGLKFSRYVALSHLKPCQNVAKKWFAWNNSLRRLWVLQSSCSP